MQGGCRSPKMGKKLTALGGIRQGKSSVSKFRPPRKSNYTETRHPVQKIWRYSQKCVLQNLARKAIKKERKKNPHLNIIFHPFTGPALRGRLLPFWHVGSHRRRNYPCQILVRFIEVLGGYRCPKSGVSH